MTKRDELTLGEKIMGLRMVNGEMMLTVEDSIAQIDMLVEELRETIDRRNLPPRVLQAVRDELEDQVLRAKEAILDRAKRRRGAQEGRE
ncbi:hypothetical protein [Bradyrhizobium sp. SZCCHNR1015]|uniref:hypothetical protein n=1 Tax=Bradyrhizobium sp. SZCCHNR1015 TaxID=3057338 RepID=UPI0029160FE3|nr:hypothetical protein [Bradyrhizobium sp. SZCCHNR1015]